MAILQPCQHTPIKMKQNLEYIQTCAKVMSVSITPAKILKYIPLISMTSDRVVTHHVVLVTKVHKTQIYLNKYNTNFVLTNSLTTVLEDLTSQENQIFLKVDDTVYMVSQ
uniref:22 kDa protein n=1 Tax=Lepidozia ophiovirus_pli TaxID=2983947 RepID=A0A9N6YJZ6_9VIRU|nr:TPA_asm: 22 kDa protein [Lepidozia ophiovirus_pli]